MRNMPFWYSRYLRSSGWRERRSKIAAAREYCEICGDDERLHVHHLTYDRLFDETDDDLLLVCDACHETIHYLETKGVGFGVSRQGFITNLMEWLKKQAESR